MNKQLSMYNILNLVNYDVKHNFSSWFKLIGVQAAIVFVLSMVNLFVGYFLPEMMLLGAVLHLVLALFFMFFPIMLLQNALDLAFDSEMRGFAVQGQIFGYLVVRALHHIFVGLVFAPFLFLSAVIIFGYDVVVAMLSNFLTLTPDMLIISGVSLCSSLITLPIILLGIGVSACVWLRLQFASLDFFEYGSGIIGSFKNSYKITKGNIFYLVPFMLLQIGVMLSVKYFLEFMTNPAELLLNIIYLDILIDVVLFMAESFVMVWIALISAHLYRQLVCPSQDNPSCASCDSCADIEDEIA